MAWRNQKQLANLPALAGEVGQQAVDVVLPAQAVAVLDDYSHAVAPRPVPHLMARANASGAVGEFSGFRIRAGAAGFWLTAEIHAAGGARQWGRERTPAPTPTITAPQTPEVWQARPGYVVGTTFAAVRYAALPPGVSLGALDQDTFTNQPMFLPPGEGLLIVLLTANTSYTGMVRGYEIPLAPPK